MAFPLLPLAFSVLGHVARGAALGPLIFPHIGRAIAAKSSGGVFGKILEGSRTFAKNQASPFLGIANSAAQRFAPGSKFAQATQTAYDKTLGHVKPDAAKMPGLSPSQLIGMAGKSQAEIQSAHQAEQQSQAAAATQAAPTLPQNFSKAGIALAALTSGITLAIKPMEAFGRSVLMGQEHLRKYNGAINAAFSRLDVGNIRRDVNNARASQGTTSILADDFNELLNELQPIKQLMQTATNGIAIIVVNSARLLAFFALLNPAIGALVKAGGALEDWLNKGKLPVGLPEVDFIHNLAHGKFINDPPGPFLPPIPFMGGKK